jgi:hypothetical protein
MIFLTGTYQAIKIAVGRDNTKPIAKPAVTEIKLLVISVQNTPRDIIVPIDFIVSTIFGKLLAVCGFSDKRYHKIIAVAREISNQAVFGILLTFFYYSYASPYLLILSCSYCSIPAVFFKVDFFSPFFSTIECCLLIVE